MADVASALRSWSTTAASNSPSGSTVIGAGLDDNLREIQAVVRKYLASQGSNMASGATIDLSTADGYYINVTGSGGPITSLGTEAAGITYLLKFASTPTITHNATSLILPGGANITAAAGDVMLVVSEGSGNWRCSFYQKADGTAVVGSVSAASQAQEVSAAATTVYTSPGRQHYHPAMPKALLNVTQLSSTVPAVSAVYNTLGTVTASRAAAGDHTFSWANTVTTGHVQAVAESDSSAVGRICAVSKSGFNRTAATSLHLLTTSDSGAGSDPDAIYIAIYGTLP